MISIKLQKSFNDLELEDKKKKISDEILFISELIKKLEIYYGINPNFQIKNYETNSKLSEEEMLTFLYDNIFEIEKQILTIINTIQKSQ